MTPHAVYELRRYRLRPGHREALIELFDRQFVEPQEAAGMRLDGEFRDPADPDAFVWVRSFEDMTARTAALETFYGGDVWKAFAPAARVTMRNTENVLLLKPAGAALPFPHNRDRQRERAQGGASGVTVVHVCSLAPRTEDDAAGFFAAQALPLLRENGARIDGVFVTEHGANGFARLPVREGETVLVWFESFADDASLAGYRARLQRDARWTDEVHPTLDARCWRPIESTVLIPTARSLCAW